MEPAPIWRHREAHDVRLVDRFVIAALTSVGIVSVVRLADWWFHADHVSQPVLFALLSLAFWYGISRIVLGWINYLAITKVPQVPSREGRRVAIFITSSPGEPLSMFERTLEACWLIRYPHTTYLLDDTRDERFGEVASRFGARYLEIVGLAGAKAGKINRALELTDEEFILVLDPDHIPFPEFLDRVIGYFDDHEIGFVQVSQAYYNQSRSFTANAAAEQTYGFYGPIQMGLSGHGAAVAIGANCTFRRAALNSIKGHGIGLAEDLVTAIRLHAAGWKSVYVPEVVSRGLVPEDLGSFFRQQLKWSRGVYEVGFAELPRAIRKLSWRQSLSYMAIGTYYLAGVTTLIYLIFPYLYLWTGYQPASMSFAEFLAEVWPVAVVGGGLYLYVQRWMCDRSTETGVHWRGLALKIACWPIFLAGTLLALIRADIPYIPTAKEAVKGRFLMLASPSLALIAIFLVTVAHVIDVRMLRTSEGSLELSSEAVWGMLFFATLPVLMSLVAIFAAWQARRIPSTTPWADVDVKRIGGR